MSNLSEIMEQYNAGKKTLEEANAALTEYGICLKPLSDEERAAKKQQEDEQGYIPATEDAKPLPKTPDMRRRPNLAGQVVIQHVQSGYFAVTYDENGYAGKARRVTFAD